LITPEETTHNSGSKWATSVRWINWFRPAAFFVVCWQANSYQHQGLSLAGDPDKRNGLGLIKPPAFDETKAVHLYAVWWIRQSILQALAEQGRLVHIQNESVYLQQGKQSPPWRI